MTTTATPASPLGNYSAEEQKSGRQVREIFLKIFDKWKVDEFAEILASNKAVDPVWLWQEIFRNPITALAGKLIKGHITPENAQRIFMGFNVQEVLVQIRDHRPDLLSLAQSPAGMRWILFYLNGFKQCICPHKGFVVRQGQHLHCTLCGKVEQG